MSKGYIVPDVNTFPPPPEPTHAPTPRTDIFVNDHLSMWPNWDWQDHASAFANWARDLERELAAKDREIANALAWIANKMLQPEWDSFKKSIEVADHWKARAEKAEADSIQIAKSWQERVGKMNEETDQLRAAIDAARQPQP